jgi:hypothetical protein
VRNYAHENPYAVSQYAPQAANLIATSYGLANPSAGAAITSAAFNGFAYISSGGEDAQRYIGR